MQNGTSTNTRQTDGVLQYIDWATGKGFGVVDINIPHYITHPEVCSDLPWYAYDG